MIRWTFFFVDKDTYVHDCKTEDADMEIFNQIHEGDKVLEIEYEKKDMYLNMALVKCTAREIIDEQQLTADNQVQVPDNEGGPY